MRVEQQNGNIIDVLQQINDMGEKEEHISFSEAAAEKCGGTVDSKSINLKDATYLKPGTEEKETVAEEIEENAAVDAEERKNQMTVLSNTTSAEDYAKMQEDGFALDSTTGNAIVTVTDKIKAQLAKAGVDISCFGDDLNLEQLEAITGSPQLAEQLVSAFRKQDLPLTEENSEEAVEALQMAESIQVPGDGAIKYMLDNGLEPTVENLYRAEHSGSSSYRPGEAVDISSFTDQIERVITQAGLPVNEKTMGESQWMLENDIPLTEENLKYLEALKSGTYPVDPNMLMEGIAAAVAEGGRPQDAMLLPGYDLQSRAQRAVEVVSGATEDDIRYVIEHEMKMNIRNLERAKAAGEGEAGRTMSAAPPERAGGTKAATALEEPERAGGINSAMVSEEPRRAGGINSATVSEEPGRAGGTKAATMSEEPAGARTVAALEEAGRENILGASGTPEKRGTSGTSEEAASDLNMGSYEEGSVYTRQGLAVLSARRQLEEIRLTMTTEANYSLLKKGIAIDTESLEKLIEDLRAQEDAYYKNLLSAQGVEPTEENISTFRETSEKIAAVKIVPAYVLGIRGMHATVNALHQEGNILKERFDKANARYETLMVTPQEELGDSFEKAFGNVDEILKELNLENLEANRRAVRILAYNQLEITPQSVAETKYADEEVQRAFKNMTPAVVTQMIKEGINPLDMNIEDLNQTVEQIKKEVGDDGSRKFGEFLWKLERNDAINEDERSSYIGIYRLIHQVEGTDGAAVGALVNQGADVTMRNLMMAVRTERKSRKMDYVVDDSFGERVNNGNQKISITSQIDIAYQKNCLKDVIESVTPEKLRAVMEERPEWDSLLPEQFKEALNQAETRTQESEKKLDVQYAREQLEQFQESVNASQDIYEVLGKYDIPNTMANITALDAMIQNRNAMFERIFGKPGKGTQKPEAQKAASEKKPDSSGQEILEEFEHALAGPDEMSAAQEKLEAYAQKAIEEGMDREDVTSIDVRQMRLLSTQLSIAGRLARDEQYSVPVLAGDEVINVSLKIVRGTERKGIVDVTMETEARGKIAATFQAKNNGVNGMIAVDRQETRDYLQEHADLLKETLGGEENPQIHYAYIKDLDLNHFSMGLFGVEAEKEGQNTAAESRQVQTTRLYHIAESFIRTIREAL